MSTENVVALLKSKFDISAAQVEPLSSLSNQVYKITTDDGAKYVFKMFSFKQNEIFRLHEQHALRSSKIADSYLYSDNLYRLERYIDNIEVAKADVISEPMSAFHMNCLARFNRSNAIVSDKPNLFYVVERSKTRLLDIMASNVAKLKDVALRREMTTKLQVINRVYEHYRQAAAPEALVLSHNDCYYRNFLFCAKERRLQLIDFEFAGYNPLGMDVLGLYTSYIFANEASEASRVSLCFDNLPSDAQFRRILRFYLFFYKYGEAYDGAEHDEQMMRMVEADNRFTEISDEEVNAILSRFGYYGALIEIFLIYWELYLCGSDESGFDYIGFAKLRYEILGFYMKRDGLDIKQFESQVGV